MSFSSTNSSSTSHCPQSDLTALNLYNSIFDCSDDSKTAIKFMRMDHEWMNEFITVNNRNRNHHHTKHHKHHHHSIKHSNSANSHSATNNHHNHRHRSTKDIRHETDTDTTLSISNETIASFQTQTPSQSHSLPMHNQTLCYSQDDIKAAQQLLNIHSFITLQVPMLNQAQSQSQNQSQGQMHQNGKNQKVKTKNIRRKHPRNFKKINDEKSQPSTSTLSTKECKIECIEALNDLDCINKDFRLNSASMHALDLKFQSKQLCFEELKFEWKSLFDLNSNKDNKKKRKYTKRKDKKEKAYKCKICNKSFSTKTNLTKHQIIHDGQRRFYCKFCSKGYLQKWRFKKHQAQCSNKS